MKKRVLALALAALMSVTGLATTGCSNSAGKQEATGGEAGSPNFEGDSSKEFYMVTFLSGYPFWTNCYRGFEAAGELYGVKTVYAGTTEYDINAAITALDQIIAKKPAGIAVTCMDAEAYIPSINKAIEQGIPVITFDSDSPNSKRISYIGTENTSAGAKAADYIGEKLGGKGKVAAVMSLGQTNISDRVAGFEARIKEAYPDIELVQIVDGGTDQVVSATAVGNLMKANPDIDYLFCASVAQGLGAVTALQEANLTDKTKIVSFDTDDVTLDAIKSGEIEATVTQGPWCEGYWAMNFLYFIEAGMINSVDNWQEKGYPSVPVNCDSGAMLVTVDTVDMFYVEEGNTTAAEEGAADAGDAAEEETAADA